MSEEKTAPVQVAVICFSYRVFMEWVKENQKENETYSWINSINKAFGKHFNRIEVPKAEIGISEIYNFIHQRMV